MKTRKIFRSLAFILLLAVALMGIMQCYGLPKTYDTRNLAALEAEKENTIDGLVIGTSVVAYSWNTPVAWQDYGMGIYHMSTSEQPFGVTTEFIEYVNKKHDLKYVVVDVHGLRKSTVYASLKDSKVQSAYLNFPNAFYRLKILRAMFDYAKKAFEYYGEPTENKEIYIKTNSKSYYFPFYSFHSRWVDGLEKADFVTIKNEYLGANDRDNAFGVKNCTEHLNKWNYEVTGEIDDFQKDQLEKLFEYCKEKNIELVFISLPSFRSLEEQKEIANLVKYCSEKGYDTIDFANQEILKDAGIDVSKDFVNTGHLNSRGGIKSTKYVCEFLIEKGYYTKDHRGEDAYSSWEEATKNYFQFYENGWKNKK